MYMYMSLHAEAEPLNTPELDAGRKLVDLGHQDVARVIAFAKGQISTNLAGIYHSTAIRARETAEGYGKHINSGDGVTEAEGLMADDDITDWLDRARTADQDFWIVGHMQNLKRIAGDLLANDNGAHPVQFKRGGISCLERREDGTWCVLWVVTPDLVRNT